MMAAAEANDKGGKAKLKNDAANKYGETPLKTEGGQQIAAAILGIIFKQRGTGCEGVRGQAGC